MTPAILRRRRVVLVLGTVCLALGALALLVPPARTPATGLLALLSLSFFVLVAPRRHLPVAEVRAELLSKCEAERKRVRWERGEDGKKIARGLDAARAAIESVPLDLARDAWFAALDAALERAREPLAADPDDEDGWALGGVAWMRSCVEDARAFT